MDENLNQKSDFFTTPRGRYVVAGILVTAALGIAVWVSVGTIKPMTQRAPALFYQVKLSLNQGIVDLPPYAFDFNYGQSNLGDHLLDVLEISPSPVKSTYRDKIVVMVYDKFNSIPPRSSYRFLPTNLLVLFEPNANINLAPGIYKNNHLTAEVYKADESLLPFVQDSSYCEKDTDCSVGTNFCNYGSFNKYHVYAEGWGCEGVHYPQEGDNIELQSLCEYPNYPRFEYSDSRCLENKCVAQGRTMTCDGTLPI